MNKKIRVHKWLLAHMRFKIQRLDNGIYNSEAILTESNQELPISFSLVWGESEDASQIVRFFRVFFLQREKSIQQNLAICFLALNDQYLLM